MTGSCYSIHHLSFHSWLGKTLRNCAKIGLSKRDAALQKHIHFQAMPDWTLPGKLASATARQESVPEARIVSEFSIPLPPFSLFLSGLSFHGALGVLCTRLGRFGISVEPVAMQLTTPWARRRILQRGWRWIHPHSTFTWKMLFRPKKQVSKM